MQCPRCAARLHVQRVEDGTMLHFCPEGHGAHVTRRDLQRAIPPAGHAALLEAIDASAPGDARCAACRRPMRVLFKRGIELDACATCGGVWFDGRELERVKRQPGRDSPVPGDPPEGPDMWPGYEPWERWLAQRGEYGVLWLLQFLTWWGKLVAPLPRGKVPPKD